MSPKAVKTVIIHTVFIVVMIIVTRLPGCLKASIQELKEDTDITDVTLACDDQSIKAHKVILSACTLWFENLG